MSTTAKDRAVTIARLSVACREDRGTPETQAAARGELATMKLERHIQKALAAAPPLTDQQRARLAALLSGGASR